MMLRLADAVVLCLISAMWVPTATAQQEGASAKPRSPSMTSTDEVMRPTQHQMRLTPGLLDALVEYNIEYEVGRSVVLDAGQKRKMAEVIRRRIRTIATEDPRQGAAAEALMTVLCCEYLFDTRIDPASARGFAERLRPAIKSISDSWASFSEEARAFLDPDQQRQLAAHIEQVHEFIDRVDRRLERWSSGKMGRETGLLDRIWDEELPPVADGKSKERHEAEKDARRWVVRIGPAEWRQFFMLATRSFPFDTVQAAAGEKILREYVGKAKAIMTDEWRARVMACQVRAALRWLKPDEPLAPWAFQFYNEQSRLLAPIEALGQQFRREILALATPEQRGGFMADLRQVAEAHGMTSDEVEPMQRLFPQTQPASFPSP